MKGSLLRYVLSLFVLAPVLTAQTEPAPRAPQGIYAVVTIADIVDNEPQDTCSATTTTLDGYFNCLYGTLLSNQAIAGLALQVQWGTLNPNPPGSANEYFWNYVDDAFTQVLAWNTNNPNLPPKTIQIILTPGSNSPTWFLTSTAIPPCDPIFTGGTAPSNCGTVTFSGYQEGGGNPIVLPLPWNPVYKAAWQTFLAAFAARYKSNRAFVSIAVAGPTAASAEMTTASDSTAPTQPNGLSPNDMWMQLLLRQYPSGPPPCATATRGSLPCSAYQSSDQAFIDEWENAIDLYGEIFSGLTLVATTGAGLPNFGTNFSDPPGVFTNDCPTERMNCAAVATILSYFAESTVGGANAKATQTSGMEAARAVDDSDQGAAGVKWLSGYTEPFTTPSTQVLGGAQFNTRFSTSPLAEGCFAAFPPNSSDLPPDPPCVFPSSCTTNGCVPVACIPQACLAPGVTTASLSSYTQFSQVENQDPSALIPPEQAEYNVLNVYFDGSPVAAVFGGMAGTAPLNYLQIYYQDIQYAQQNITAQVVELSNDEPLAGTVPLTAQQMLLTASQALGQTVEFPLSVPPASLSIAISHQSNFTLGLLGGAYELTVANGVSAPATSSMVIVTDTVPTGMTLVSMQGFGWSCSGNTCFRADSLQPRAAWPAIYVTVNVAVNAPSKVTNMATVSGGGSTGANASQLTSIGPGQPPAAVTIFSPAQSETGVPVTASLSWSPASLANTYNVYFGKAKSPPLVASGLNGTSYTPANMNPSTTYYWMVTSVNGFSSTPSAVWSFTTAGVILVEQCAITLSATSTSLPATGTSTVETCPDNSQPNCGVYPETPLSFTVIPNASCGAWTATSSSPGFLQVLAGASGTGVGAVAFAQLTDTHAGQQSNTITVASGGASAAYTVTEAGSGDSQTYREVYALYEQLLGRDPDAGGFAFWTGTGGAGLGQMADSFLTSPEFFNSGFAVMAVYQAATGAAPTYAQYTAAVASIRAGTQTVTGLFDSLMGPSYTAATLYQNLLNRAPTATDSGCISTGLEACLGTIIGYPASTTPVSAPNNEFQSTGTYHTTLAADHTNALYMTMVYFVALNRDPDPSGFAFWLGIANDGGPGLLFQGTAGYFYRNQILGPGTPNQGFIGSPEFQGLFAN